MASSTIRTSCLLLVITLLRASTAQEDDTATLCSCSPTVFNFVLNLAGTCDENDIETNPGIDGSFCFVEEDVSVPAAPGSTPTEDEARDEDVCSFCLDGLVDPAFVLPTDDGTTCGQASDLAATLSPEDDVCATVKLAETLCCVTAEGAPSDAASAAEPVRLRFRRHGRRLQDFEAEVPIGDSDRIVEILSVQFLEFDTSGDLTVINQDDSYADVSLSDGDRLKFSSASSFLDTNIPLEEQVANPALVPGGASLILYGKKANGVVVRNRFFWMYDMDCGRDNEPVRVGDQIGWVIVGEDTNGPWPRYCPAQPDSPTISPRTNEPTLTPSKSPIESPSGAPIEKPVTEPPTHKSTEHSSKITSHPTRPSLPHGWWGGEGGGQDHDYPVFWSKAAKVPKTYKPGMGPDGKLSSSKSSKLGKLSKRSKGAKGGKGSKGAKNTKNAKTWYGWGSTQSSDSLSHDVQGKTSKLTEGQQVYGMEKVLGLDVERSQGGAGLYGCRLGPMVILLTSILLAWQ